MPDSDTICARTRQAVARVRLCIRQASTRLEAANLGRVVDVRAAAQLHGHARDINHAHNRAVLLSEHGNRTGGARLFQAHGRGLQCHCVANPACEQKRSVHE
jgi:hypothetical protein